MADPTPDSSVAQIEAELDKMDATVRNPLRNIGVLILSIALFVIVGRLRFSAEYVIMLVIVLFIHEAGHWIGMKMFGYRDVKMFFIPFFGAAVSGKQQNPSGAAQAIVILLGPAPGILLGLAAAILSTVLHQPLLMKYALISVAINLLNMLPVFPLDGGRFFEAVVFSRYSFLEIIFRLLAALALGLLAWRFSSVIFGMLALVTLLAVRETWLIGRIVSRFKKRNPAQPIPPVISIPHEQLEQIMPDLSLGYSRPLKPKTLAIRAQSIWQKLRRKSPGFWASVALLACYAGVVLAAVVPALFVAASLRHVKVVQRPTNDGGTVAVQETYYGKYKIEEAQLDSRGFYNGPATIWSIKGVKQQEGYYVSGYRDGDWKIYDARGGLHAMARYVEKAPVYYGIYQGDVFRGVSPGEWPDSVKYTWVNPQVSDAAEPRDFHWYVSRLKQRLSLSLGNLKK